ncbi:T9SS type A sorting domain-containing protein [candidate division WOR-3 bacterium]|nr:T9SS type A sorting domain-containing protein [candidate division WOR-3 bacterium]
MVVCALMILVCSPASLIAHESVVRDPHVTRFGVVMTDQHYGHIYVYRDGSIVPLVSSPGCGRYYTVSPDHARIGFKMIFENGLQASAYVDIRNGIRTILHPPCEHAGQVSFAASGAIAYTIGDHLCVQREEQIEYYDLGAYANCTSISPDGTRVVFNDHEDQLWVLALATDLRERITPGSAYGFCMPEWSGDSRFVLYRRLDNYLYVYDTDSGATYELPQGHHAHWAPDHRTISFCLPLIEGYEVVRSDLYTVRFDGSDIKRLTPDAVRFATDPRYYMVNRIVFCDGATNAVMTGVVRDAQVVDITELFRYNDTDDMPPYHVQGPAARDSLDVPYLNQVYDTPDWFNGHWACAPSTAMMAIAYYAKLPVWSCWCSSPYGHTSDFGRYICEHYWYREVDYTWQAQDPSGTWASGGYGYMWSGSNRPYTHMAPYLENHDIMSWRDDSPTFNETIGEINAGYPYGMCVGLTTAGHLVLAIGQVLDWHTLIFNDPYGNKNTPGYPSYDGKYARYDWPGYNNGYENLNSVYWCVGAHGDWEPPSDTIVDDLQFASGFYLHTASPSSMEYWRDALIGHNGHMWWTHTTASTTYDTCYAVWMPFLPVNGDYEVFAYIPGDHANANAARYYIRTADYSLLVIIDQSGYTDEWVSLGTYPFETTTAYVYLGDGTGVQGQYIGFDALRWNYQGQGIREHDPLVSVDGPAICNNPVADHIAMTVFSPASTMILFRLYSVTGQCVKEQTIPVSGSGEHHIRIDVSDCASGVYVARTIYGTTIYTKKIVIINR